METAEQTERVPAERHNCRECGSEFKNAWGLRVHFAKKHGPNRNKPMVAKRKYTKRSPAEISVEKRNDLAVGTKAQDGVNYCPCCGTDMRGVKLAIKLTSRS